MQKYDKQFPLNNAAEVFYQIIEYPWEPIPYNDELKKYIKIEFGQRIGVPEPEGTAHTGQEDLQNLKSTAPKSVNSRTLK